MSSDADTIDSIRRDRDRLWSLINNPFIGDFFEAVRIERAHQESRWGLAHDYRKSVEEWTALLVRLLGKAVDANWQGDGEKLRHHIVTAAAVLANMHEHLFALREPAPAKPATVEDNNEACNLPPCREAGRCVRPTERGGHCGRTPRCSLPEARVHGKERQP